MRKAAIIIFVLLIGTLAMASGQLKCSICGKTITGQYLKFDDGSVYCMECVNKYPACSICKKPSPNTTVFNGEHICRDCLIKLDRCSFCGQPLTGKFYTYPDLHLKLCPKCNSEVPRCDICGRPDLNLIRVGEKRICKSCFDKADYCHICGNPIQGEYMWFDNDSTKLFCSSCVDKYPRCASCGAPAGKYSRTLEDGRVLCGDCYKKGYFDADKVKHIKERVLVYLDNHFNMTLDHKVRYSLQGQDYIVNKSNGISGDLNGLFYSKGDKFEIYVLYGLREKDLYQVVPHEIAHAWAAENLREDLTLEEAEGFAQWIAYYALKHFGFHDHSETLLVGDNEYARGLRMMLDIEKKGGRSAVFSNLAR